MTDHHLIAGLGSDDEVRLVEFLFERQGYNPLIRPVRNLKDTVKVNFGLAMIQLINVVSTIFHIVVVVGLGSDDEIRLVEFLFERQGYNPLIRPVANLTQVVQVSFGLALIQLISIVSTVCAPLIPHFQP